jgi:hypothetical protein
LCTRSRSSLRPLFALALLLPCAVLRAQAPLSCTVYARDSGTAPALVHAWLQHSDDVRVSVCHRADADSETLQYLGEGATRRQGGVCSYASHGLSPVGATGARRLQRYEQSEGLAMKESQGSGACPPERIAGVSRYVLTYDLKPEEFLALSEWWTLAAQSSHALEGPGTEGEAAARLRAQIAAGRLREVRVLRMVRLPGSAFRRRYSLFVPDPEQPAVSAYVLYLSRRAHGSWQLTGIADTTP